MTDIDLGKLTPSQLIDLIDKAQTQIGAARARVVEEARAKIDTILVASKLTLDDVYPRRRKRGARGTSVQRAAVPPKYRNPANPTQLWSGRGRKPGWIVDALKKRGVSVESFLIAPPAAARSATKKRGKRRLPRG